MTGVIRSGSAPFVPRGRLLELLGGELIRDEVMAIIELVKNAHDADASCVQLDFRGVTGEDGRILIEDDGHGMDVDALLSSWMQPAASTKILQERHYTLGGRRVLGEKGVGRFAVDRLGRHLQLESRRVGSGNEVVASFDWDEFDDENRLLSDVHSTWKEREALLFERSGTLLEICDLRSIWSERTFRKVCTRLRRLLSPFRIDDDFRIEITSDEFPDYSGILEANLLDRSPYRVEASFDSVSTVSVAFNGNEPVSHAWNGVGELACGPVRIILYGFDLDTEAMGRIGAPVEIRAWLRQWSGISIYRDDFRVLPYGEPDDDWLRLDQRRVNNPVVRLSNNQVCGFVEIARDKNPDLRDQTNRGGLIQSRAFDDLRRLVLFVIQFLESERQLVRHPPRDEQSPVYRQLDGDERSIVVELKGIAETLGRETGAPVQRLAKRLEGALDVGRRAHDAEISAYVDLAAMGQTAAFLHHAVTPPIEAIRSGLKSLEAREGEGQQEGYSSIMWRMENCLEEIEGAMGLLARVAPVGKRRRRTIDLHAELDVFENTTVHIFAEHGVRLMRERGNGQLLRAELPPETLQQVLHILLWNSLEWMDPKSDGRIRIAAKRDGDSCQIIFQDYGPGIPEQHADRIFLPQFSLKENGRGMSLTIARQILADHGASIQLLRDRRRKGVSFEIRLRPKKSRGASGR